MSWAFVCQIVFCRRDRDRLPILPEKQKTEKPQRDMMRYYDWRRGYPPHLIEQRAQEREASMKERREQSHGGRHNQRSR